MAHSKKLLAALNTSLDEKDEVVELAKRTLLAPGFNMFPRHIVSTSIAWFEFLIVGNEEEGFGGQVNDMTLAADSVDFGIVLDVKSA